MDHQPPPTPHEHRLRVRYAETDRMGVGHHGSMIDWFEEARTEWLRARGKTYRKIEDEGVFLQVVEVQIRYLHPTRYDDELVIRTRLIERRNATLTFAYEVSLAVDGTLAATGSTKLACVDGEGRVRRLPSEIAAAPSAGNR